MSSSLLNPFMRVSTSARRDLQKMSPARNQLHKFCLLGHAEKTSCTAFSRNFYLPQRDGYVLNSRADSRLPNNIIRNTSSPYWKWYSAQPMGNKNIDTASNSNSSQPPNIDKTTPHSKPPKTLPGSDESEPTPKPDAPAHVEDDEFAKFQKLSLFQKFKAMYKDYWYVLVPVHVVSSVVFFGTFYYAASSGVDIIALLEKVNVSETLIRPLRDSSAGYIAISYALYKIFTPVRYTVTLGGTMWSIKFLKDRGLIKPKSMGAAKQDVQNIICAMKMPEGERQKFLEDKGMPRIGRAVGQASSAASSLRSDRSKSKK